VIVYVPGVEMALVAVTISENGADPFALKPTDAVDRETDSPFGNCGFCNERDTVPAKPPSDVI
jgi:hypothetical protein